MADNDLIIENSTEEILIEAQKEQISVNETTANIAIDVVASSTKVEEPATVNVAIQEASGVSSGTRIVVNHNASDPNQHTISAITGLREELDDIIALKPVYSNERNVANYYKWEGNNTYDTYGYFVSMVPRTSTIKICDGSDILGVSVEAAGFIGGQDATVKRDDSYGLIVTSGLVDVRCELDVDVDNYVVSNDRGYAKKVESKYGYKVLAIKEKDGVRYAVIALGVQADVTNALGLELGEVKEQVDANYKNIISAVNVANQAYNKATEVQVSNQVISDKVDAAVGKVDGMATEVGDLSNQVANSAIISAQAKAIAESAATSAESMRNEAIESSKEALAETSKLRDEFALIEEGVTEIEDQVSIVVKQTGEQGIAIAGIQTKVSDHDSTINSLTSWQGDTNIAMARIEQKADANGAYIQSTVSNMDKYSVGPYSQAYGFTLEQAASVLEEGMIYVPTTNKTGNDAETYSYTDANGDSQTYTREFVRGYLYKWGELPSGLYGWITVDKDYNETDETNTSSQAVYFTTEEPDVSGNFGYWYTDGDGVTEGYESHTLYKWTSYIIKSDDGADTTAYHWVAVATLAGNSSNRAVSQIRQDANSIAFEVTNPQGSVAGMRAELTDASAKINSVASWPKGEGDHYLATIEQVADAEGSHLTLAAVTTDGTKPLGGATIVLGETNDDSYIQFDADKIDFTTGEFTIDANHINFDGFVSFANKSDIEEVKESAVYETLVEYALSSSRTEFNPVDGVDGQWSTSAPTWKENAHMWQRTTIVRGDGTIVPGVPTCIQGATGTPGQNGTDGSSIVWKGDLSSAPTSPQANWVYRNTGDGRVYIYTGSSWDLMVLDGSDGEDGKDGDDGADGLSVFITYNDSTSAPGTPTENGTTNGWHTNATSSSVWMSQKVAASASAGVWGAPIKIKPEDGVSPEIKNGYWWIGETNTGVKAEGKDGDTPTVTISDDGYWVINGAKTSVKAVGVDAPKVVSEKKQFYVSTSSTSLSGGSWSDSPSGFTKGRHLWTRSVYTMDKGDPIVGKEILDKTYTTISSWCDTNNTTLIDGANIATGTMTANKITTGQLQSDGYEDKNSTVYSDKGTRFNLDDGSITAKNFAVTKTGTLWAKGANIEGDITATSGSFTGTVTTAAGDIGGWVIEPGFIVSENKSVGFYSYDDDGVDMGNTTHYSLLDGNLKTVRFFAGAPDTDNLSSAPFKVLSDGSLYASAAEITGNITATGGKIGGWSLNGTELVNYSGTKDADGYYPYSFCMQTAGNGAVNALAIGKANENTWGQAAFRVTPEGKLYATNAEITGKIVATSGEFGGFAINKSALKWKGSASLYEQNTPQLRIEVLNDGGGYLGFSMMDAASVQFYSGLSVLGSSLTANELLFDNGDKSARIKFANGVATLSGTWKGTSGSNITSDQNAKHNIQDISDDYEIVFDNLQSRIFKYNDGTSDRCHTGFIAQEVDEAVSQAGLTRKDFAAICIAGDGTEPGSWGLRYSEFVSLNTWQIQKLKARTTELENYVKKLEERIAQLENK